MDWTKRTSPLVAGIRVHKAARPGSSRRIQLFPDGAVGLLFQMTDGSVARTSSRTGDLYVLGTRTHAIDKIIPAVPLALALRFHPGTAWSIFGVPADELTDRVVRLDDIWGPGADRLRDSLLCATTVDEMVTTLEGAVEGHVVPGCETSIRIVQHAVHVILRSATRVRVEQLADKLGVTPRHFRRIFTAAVGVGPKEFSRIVRFHRATRAARREQSWARVAAEAGYYDQAHMIRDFRALAGATPSQVRNRQRVEMASE